MIDKNKKATTQQLLFDLMFLMQARMKKVVKDADANLSPLQILILRTLSEYGEMTQQELGQRMGRDKAQITRLIQELEKRELIFKERNPYDKRSFIINVKPKVHEKVSYFIQYEKAIVKEMLNGVSATDIQTFEKVLAQMSDNIQP